MVTPSETNGRGGTIMSVKTSGRLRSDIPLSDARVFREKATSRADI